MKHRKSAIAVYGTVVAAIVLSSVPSSRYLPISLVEPIRAISVALPQGWAFFTRDPTEQADSPYVSRHGQWVPVSDALPWRDAVGLTRRARAVDAEVSSLEIAANTKGVDCATDEDLQRCAEQAPHVRQRFDAAVPPLCEPVLVKSARPIPFAYGTRVSAMPSTIVVVDVECHE